jgi:hypothetical protein
LEKKSLSQMPAVMDLDSAFNTLGQQPVGALVDESTDGRRNYIVALAARHTMPAICDRESMPRQGTHEFTERTLAKHSAKWASMSLGFSRTIAVGDARHQLDLLSLAACATQS